jgi:hypothetical protein
MCVQLRVTTECNERTQSRSDCFAESVNAERYHSARFIAGEMAAQSKTCRGVLACVPLSCAEPRSAPAAMVMIRVRSVLLQPPPLPWQVSRHGSNLDNPESV